MQRKILVLLAALAIALCSSVAFAGGGNPEAANGGAFLHIARNMGDQHDNTEGNSTFLVSEYPGAKSSPMTDGNPNALVFLTHNLTFTTANQSAPFGVYYAGGLWRIFNENMAPMVGGEAFNVQVQSTSKSIFVHGATAENVTNNYTLLDHALLNGNPNALVSATQRWEGFYNPHQIGVFYNIFSERWAIFNQDTAPMPVGAKFNVQVLMDADVDFMHIASTVVQTSKTEIDHPLLNGNNSAKLIVTQNWGNTISGVYNDNPIGVEYDNGTNKWRIVNTNGVAMPENARFNVHIASLNMIADGAFVNGGFEAGTFASNTAAAGWDTSAAGAGSARVCDKYVPNVKIVSNTGECAYMLVGAAGQTRFITQNVTLSDDMNGDMAVLQMWLKGAGVSGLSIKAKIKTVSSGTVKIKLPGAAINGTYGWSLASNSLLLPPGADATKIKLLISLTGTGKVYIDDAIGFVDSI